jgi:hypothetical protein
VSFGAKIREPTRDRAACGEQAKQRKHYVSPAGPACGFDFFHFLVPCGGAAGNTVQRVTHLAAKSIALTA